MIPRLRKRFDRLAWPLGLLGLVVALGHNRRAWRRDRALLAAPIPPPPPPPGEWPATPLVSVLVAAWNESANIDRHIAGVLALRYPRLELVLCAGGDDDTYARARRYVGPIVKVLRQYPGEGKARALARALRQARGEIIFLTDADCRPTDEPFERTLWPVAVGGEAASTGGSRPFDEQMADPFVFTQAATQLYSARHSPAYAPGLLGRNAAIRRALLETTAALDVPAPTGTDYVLAKTLHAAGARILQLPDSLMPTAYPTAPRAYLRQQRRWLRTVARGGRRFGAPGETRAARRTSLVGLVMLWLPPLGVLFSPPLLMIWSALLAQASLARLRYLSFAAAVLGRPVKHADVALQGPFLLLDWTAWAWALVDYVRRKGGGW
jgi:glycosyltransferase involved in cell wall biosynthesis